MTCLNLYPFRNALKSYLHPYDFASALIASNMKPSEYEKNTYMNISERILYDNVHRIQPVTCRPKICLLGNNINNLIDHMNCEQSTSTSLREYSLKAYVYCDCIRGRGDTCDGRNFARTNFQRSSRVQACIMHTIYGHWSADTYDFINIDFESSGRTSIKPLLIEERSMYINGALLSVLPITAIKSLCRPAVTEMLSERCLLVPYAMNISGNIVKYATVEQYRLDLSLPSTMNEDTIYVGYKYENDDDYRSFTITGIKLDCI